MWNRPTYTTKLKSTLNIAFKIIGLVKVKPEVVCNESPMVLGGKYMMNGRGILAYSFNYTFLLYYTQFTAVLLQKLGLPRVFTVHFYIPA